MRRVLKLLGWLLLAGCALALLVVAVGVAWGLPFVGHTEIAYDGNALTVSSLSLGAVLLGLAVAAVAVLAAVAAPLLALGLALIVTLLALAGVATVLCSPLLVLAGLVWLIWRLAHRPAADATMRR